MELDNTDKKILNVMIKNSRLSMRQIAKKTNVSVATVMHHIRKLEADKVLLGNYSKIDYEKLGYDVEVVIEMRISKGKLMEVEKKIATDPHVCAVYDVTGPFDAIILARFPSRRRMDNFLKRIQTFEFVERTETQLILKTIKEEQIEIE